MKTQQLIRCLLAFAFVHSIFLSSFAAENTLTQLTDEQLIEILWRDDAKEEFQRRLGSYSKEKKDELTKKLEAHSAAKKTVKMPPPDELLDILLTSRPGPGSEKATNALKKYYEGASSEERSALKDLIIEKGLRVPMSEEYSESLPIGTYADYTRRALLIFSEEEGLEILERLYLDRKIYAAVPNFIHMLQNVSNKKGAAVAKRLEDMYGSIEQYPFNMLMEEPGALRGQIIVTLGGCGEAGLEVLERIGWNSEAGAHAIGMTGTTRARELLLARYNRVAPSPARPRIVVLSALSRRLYASDEVSKAFVRQELPQFLTLPASDFYTATVNEAVGVVSLTNDPVFIPQLEELLSSIQSQGFGNSTEATFESPSEITDRETEAIERITKLLAKLRGKTEATSQPKS